MPGSRCARCAAHPRARRRRPRRRRAGRAVPDPVDDRGLRARGRPPRPVQRRPRDRPRDRRERRGRATPSPPRCTSTSSTCATGECLTDPAVRLPVHRTWVAGGVVYVHAAPTRRARPRARRLDDRPDPGARGVPGPGHRAAPGRRARRPPSSGAAPDVDVVPDARASSRTIDEDALVRRTEELIERPPDIVVVTTGIGFRSWLDTAEAAGLAEHAARRARRHAAGRPRARRRAAPCRPPGSAPTGSRSPRRRRRSPSSCWARASPAGGSPYSTTARATRPMERRLRRRRAPRPCPLDVYRWGPPPDPAAVAGGREDLGQGRYDAVLFTSAPGRAGLARRAARRRARWSSRGARSTAGSCSSPRSGRSPPSRSPTRDWCRSRPTRSRMGALVRLVITELGGDRNALRTLHGTAADPRRRRHPRPPAGADLAERARGAAPAGRRPPARSSPARRSSRCCPGSPPRPAHRGGRRGPAARGAAGAAPATGGWCARSSSAATCWRRDDRRTLRAAARLPRPRRASW